MTEEEIGQCVQNAINIMGVIAVLTMEGMKPEIAPPSEPVIADGIDFGVPGPVTLDNAPFDFFNLACSYLKEKEDLWTPFDRRQLYTTSQIIPDEREEDTKAREFFESLDPNLECWLASTFRGSGIESITIGQFMEKNYHKYVGVLLFPKLSPEWVYWWPEHGYCEGTLLRLKRGHHRDGVMRQNPDGTYYVDNT